MGFDLGFDLYHLELFHWALFDVFELLLARFEPFGGRYVRDRIFGASLGLLGFEIGLFELSNSAKLSVKGMKPRITCYVIDVEVMYMLGDRRVGVHPVNCDFIVFKALNSGPILLISVFLPCDKVIELSIMLDIMFRIYVDIVGTHSGRFLLSSH